MSLKKFATTFDYICRECFLRKFIAQSASGSFYRDILFPRARSKTGTGLISVVA